MAEKVFLHIGAPKTGTTFLQQLMAANQEKLAAGGFLYAAGAHGSDRIWATEVLRGRNLSKHPKPQAAQGWERIRAQVGAWNGAAIFSHEFLGACSRRQAQRALHDLAPAEVHIVFTARDYVRQVAAVWQERLKYGLTDSLADFTLDEGSSPPVWSWRTQDVPAILRRWSAELPPERVHVVTVPSEQGSSSVLWRRFASAVGIDPGSCEIMTARSNTSMGLVEAELLRQVNERIGGRLEDVRERARWIRDLLANRVLVRRTGEAFSVSAEEAHRLRHRSLAAVEALSQAGYHVVGSLDDLIPPSDAATSLRAAADVTEGELLAVAVDAIADLLVVSARRDRRHGGRSP